MQIRIRSTGQVLSQNDWEKWVAQTYAKSLSGITEEAVNRFESDILLEGPQPTPARYQFVVADGVEEIDGKWYTKYILSDMDQQAKDILDATQAKAVRQERTEILRESDWTQLADSSADKTTWATYRQALRNVPSQEGFPWTITWPTQP
jgi:hypothetical protein